MGGGMSRPFRVLACHNFYSEGGGEEAVFNSEVKGLRRAGHEVIVYSRQNSDIAEWGARQTIARVPELLRSWRTRREITDLVATARPDVAIVQNVFPLI